MKQKIILLAALFLLHSCGQAPNTIEETCLSGQCTETEINAPVAGIEESEEEALLPPSTQNYRMPAYSSSWGLSRRLYDKTVRYYDANYNKIPNKAYVTVIDFNLASSKKRFFLFNLATGKVEKHLTSHGAGSDPDNDRYATLFSNVAESRKSSLGFYLTLSTYTGKYGYSLRLRGLQSTNSNAEARAIVMHPAPYVSEKDNYAGRSWGCPALDPSISKSVISRVRSGSLILIDK